MKGEVWEGVKLLNHSNLDKNEKLKLQLKITNSLKKLCYHKKLKIRQAMGHLKVEKVLKNSIS